MANRVMTYDFLVIGGGIAGISAGARLAPLGSVLVLEAETALAYHASGRSAALYEARYGLPVTIALNEASLDYHQNAHGGVLSPRGLMFLAGPGDDALLQDDIDTYGLTTLTPSEAKEQVPILNTDHVTAAGHHHAAWDLDADRLVQNFAKEIRESGGKIQTGEQVTDISREAGIWHVFTTSDTYSAKTLVNAAGAWADEIAKLAGLPPIGLKPLRRSMARIPAPGGHDPAGWPMLIGAGETWYAKPDAGKWLVSPAEEDETTPHDAWADDMVIAEGIARYQPFVTEEVTRVETTWAGLRTFAPDRTLVLGPDPRQPSFVWVAGQGGYGMQTAPAASQFLADIIAGRPTGFDAETVAALSPTRLT